jgi:hypothetical protein
MVRTNLVASSRIRPRSRELVLAGDDPVQRRGVVVDKTAMRPCNQRMLTLGPEESGVPRCPVPGHENSRVVLGGRYGKPGRQRQLYVCHMAKPGSSAPSHRFAAPLPRAYSDVDADGEELRSARNYQFTAHDIASGLVAVSRGASYAAAGQDVRAHAAVRWGAPEEVSRRHGSLVSDWVEVYAEALWEAQAPDPTRWPETVLVGVLPLTVGGPGTTRRLSFAVFVAMTTGPAGNPVIVDIRTSAGTGAAHWAAFLRELGRGRSGRPDRVVGDGSASLARAVAQVWPDGRDAPMLWADEQVMRDEARRICASRGLDRRDCRLWVLLQRAWRGEADWLRFTAEAHRYRIPELDRWLAEARPVMARQFAARQRRVRRSRRPLRAALAEVERRIGNRRGTFGNQARTNRLLLLMALDLSGVARVNTWAELICVWLAQGNGRPASLQRRISDPYGQRTLRGPGPL